MSIVVSGYGRAPPGLELYYVAKYLSINMLT